MATTASIDSQNAAFIAAKDAAAAAAASSSSSSSTASTAKTGQSQLDSDLNFFLTMLTTQLKNQDPTQPMDTNQFTQQIAQYSSVQQQVNTNSNLEKLIAAGNKSALTNAVSYIGKEIESKGNTGTVSGGQGAFSYVLPSAAASTTITISNAAGSVVFSGKGDTKAGRNIVVWDGVNSSTGAQEADGTYTIAVTATDASGKAITPETRAVTTVTGVETDSDGNPVLSDGTNKINYSDVIAVRDPSRISTTTASN